MEATVVFRNNRELTSLTLCCELGRDTMFQEMLEMSCIEFWRWTLTESCTAALYCDARIPHRVLSVRRSPQD